MPTRLRFLTCLVLWSLCFPHPLFAFGTPLSDTAVRFACVLSVTMKPTANSSTITTGIFRPPEKGRDVSLVAFGRPALMAALSNQQGYGYSVQQAQIDPQPMTETVKVIVKVPWTPTLRLGDVEPCGSHHGNPLGYVAPTTRLLEGLRKQGHGRRNDGATNVNGDAELLLQRCQRGGHGSW
jgi:hypothetical protein